jgi:hypothetical protein
MLGRLGFLYGVRYFLRCRIQTMLAFCMSRSGLITCPILHALPPRSTGDKHERILLLLTRRRSSTEDWTETRLTKLSLFKVAQYVLNILHNMNTKNYVVHFESVDANPQQILPAVLLLRLCIMFPKPVAFSSIRISCNRLQYHILQECNIVDVVSHERCHTGVTRKSTISCEAVISTTYRKSL